MKPPITTAQAMSHPDVALTINTLGAMADELRAERDALLAKKDAEIAELVKYKNEYCTSHAALQLVKSERDALAAKAIEHRDGRLAALEESAALRAENVRLRLALTDMGVRYGLTEQARKALEQP